MRDGIVAVFPSQTITRDEAGGFGVLDCSEEMLVKSAVGVD